MASVGTSLMKTVAKSTSGARKLLLGQIHPCHVPKAKKVVVKHMDFDEWLTMYFQKNVAYIAHDPNNQYRSGDVVLIEELSKKLTRDITHEILKVVYPLGDITDPITGKKCEGGFYREEKERLDELWGKVEGGFKYDKAPERGWQEGRKDWSHKPAQRKFHEFSDRDTTEMDYN